MKVDHILQTFLPPSPLSLDKQLPNSHGVYMIYNRPPATWTGRKINVGVYKDDKLLIVKHNVRVGDYCELKPTHKLYMCCMIIPSPTCAPGHNEIWNLFAPPKRSSNIIDDIDIEFTPLVQIDLANYPNGVDINVTEIEVSGQIKFIPKSSC